MTENELAKLVFEAGLKVHKVLGQVYWKVLTKNVFTTNYANWV